MRYQDAINEKNRTRECVIRHLMMPGHEVSRATAFEDERIGEFLRRHDWSKREKLDGVWRWTFKLPTVCVINGEFVLQRQWKRRRIKSTDEIIFMSRPMGGGRQGTKQVLGIVALIAIAALAIYTGGAALALFPAIGTVGSSLITAGITVGGSLLINTLIAPKAGTDSPEEIQQAYSISGGGNTGRPLQPIPVSYGRLKKFCDYATIPWSEFVGNDLYLNVLLVEGCGIFQHEKVYMDDIELWDSVTGINPQFDFSADDPAIHSHRDTGPTVTIQHGAQVEFYDPGQTVTLFPANVSSASGVSSLQFQFDSAGNQGPYLGPVVANNAGTLADGLALDFIFPAGMFLADKDNSYSALSLRVAAEYRLIDNVGVPIGGWQLLFNNLYTLNTRQPYRFSEKVAVPQGRYEVRASIFGQDASKYTIATNGFTGTNALVWVQLRSYLVGSSSFSSESIVAVRIRATGISQGSARQFSVLSTRKLRVWNGSAFVSQATRNPLWAFYNAAVNTDFGAAIPEAKLDFQSIVSLATGADTRGDKFDFEFRSVDTIPNAFDTILKSTRARHRWSGDLLSVVRDELKTIPQLLLTDKEIIRGSLSVNWAMNTSDSADVVIMNYLDQDIWGPAQVQYPPDVTPTNPATISVDGIIQRSMANQMAAFLWRQAQFRRSTITLQTEWEGRMLSFGSYIRVQSELPQIWGQSGRIKTVSSLVLGVYPPMDWSDSGQYFIEIRSKYGTRLGPVKVSRNGADDSILIDSTDLSAVQTAQGMTLAEALSRASTAEEVGFVLGITSKLSRDCIVIQGRPSGDRVSLTLAIDDVRVHDDDITSPPVIPSVPPVRDGVAPVITGLVANFRKGAVEPILDVSWAAAPGAASYDAGISYDGAKTWSPCYSGTLTSFSIVVDAADLDVRVRGVGKKIGAYYATHANAPTIFVDNGLVFPTSFGDGLKDWIASQLKEANKILADALHLIASLSSEQDAHNWIDKKQTRTELRVAKDNLSASILETQIVAIGTQEAFAQYQITVNAHLADNDATISTTASGLVNTDLAVANLTSSVSSRFAGTTPTVIGTTASQAAADASTALTAVTSPTGALANLSSSVDARFSGGTPTTIGTTANTALANANTALFAVANPAGSVATYTATVEARFAGSSPSTIGSMASDALSAAATIDGKFQASWIVQLDVNGYVSGVKSYNDGHTSSFIIVASVFEIAQPSVGGGAPVPVFAISPVNGINKLVFRGDMLSDGTIAARHMSANSIAATTVIADNIILRGKLLADTATAVQYSEGVDQTGTFSAAGQFVDLIIISFDVAVGRMLTDASFEFSSTSGCDQNATVALDLYINNLLVRSANSVPSFINYTPGPPEVKSFFFLRRLFNLTYSNFMSIGTFQWKIRVRCVSLGTAPIPFSWALSAPNVRVLEARR